MSIWSLSIDLSMNLMFVLLDMDDLWNVLNQTQLMGHVVSPGSFAACH